MKFTKKFLEEVPAHETFAAGLVMDTDEVNIYGERRLLRWAAVRGEAPDWAVYTLPIEWNGGHPTFDNVAALGDKVSKGAALKLVDCDEGMASAYRC